MKKKLILIIVLVTILSIIGIIVIPKMIEKDTVKDLNSNSEFGLDLLYKLSDEDWDQYNVLSGFGMDIIYDKELPPAFDDDDFFDIHEYSKTNPATMYDITSYPNIIGDYGYVTKIETTDPNYHLFNLSVGEDIDGDLISETLENYHYTLDESYQHDDIEILVYKRSKVLITIYTDYDVITRIQIRIKVRSIPGIVF
jgi:hypothetical protein